MQEHPDFLQAILDAPEDDAPRLIYADWLEENGQPERAEFIRLECEEFARRLDAETAPNHGGDSAYWVIADRLKELFDLHEKDWFHPLHQLVGNGEYETRRGFPWLVDLTARKFAQAAGEIFDVAPTIEDVCLRRLGKNTPEIAKCPALGNVRSLELFETPFRAREAELFFDSPYLGKLREFRIGFMDTQMGTRGARALAEAKSLQQLETLDVYNHAIQDVGAQAILGSETLATLKYLHLGNNGLTDQTADALFQADHLQLKLLDLMENHLSDDGVRQLTLADHLAGLETFSLMRNPIGREAIGALVKAPFIASLKTLSLSGCQLDDKSIVALLRSPLRNLRDLSLSENVIGDEGAKALADNSALKHLASINLRGNGIGNRGALALTDSECLANVQALYLSENNISPKVQKRLTDVFGDRVRL